VFETQICSASLLVTPKLYEGGCEALVAWRAMIKKKLQDSQRILQLTIANSFD